MDPLTQGALGAALPQSASSSKQVGSAALLGFLAGMAADLDVLIRSSEDPLLFLEYHRQFTHALVFIPIGGALCALVLHALLGRRRGLGFRETWLFCTLGYATHALLDACTTYGTMLLWPFSEQRFAWNTISIIDPLFTLPLLLAVVLAVRLKRPQIARLGLLWAVCYMGLGLVQRDAAEEMGRALAAERGHAPLRLEAKPSFANILVWKVVYETNDRFHVDAVRASLWPRVFPGDSVPKLDIDRDLPWLDRNSQQAQDIERFRWFSNGYIARDPIYTNRIMDIRYSLLPNDISPLWSIELQPDAGRRDHVRYRTHRDAEANSAATLWQMLTRR
ncbi:metal-dependent hydrolase [Pseudohalioglobus sediminis]|uniref:Metal-dependent hydrolase n=1 Tax=Pseudohalioglobus sediminis TaxID=2606449 RepID=A0A5B0X5X7_9GAMM|nr:metal-dependent hydrolase [Pseudohalioglobus sediminis]KAA1193907.1 metal-dependent hydrolase [Pseudohalioglobus sediminis]